MSKTWGNINQRTERGVPHHLITPLQQCERDLNLLDAHIIYCWCNSYLGFHEDRTCLAHKDHWNSSTEYVHQLYYFMWSGQLITPLILISRYGIVIHVFVSKLTHTYSSWDKGKLWKTCLLFSYGYARNILPH